MPSHLLCRRSSGHERDPSGGSRSAVSEIHRAAGQLRFFGDAVVF